MFLSNEQPTRDCSCGCNCAAATLLVDAKLDCHRSAVAARGQHELHLTLLVRRWRHSPCTVVRRSGKTNRLWESLIVDGPDGTEPTNLAETAIDNPFRAEPHCMCFWVVKLRRGEPLRSNRNLSAPSHRIRWSTARNVKEHGRGLIRKSRGARPGHS